MAYGDRVAKLYIDLLSTLDTLTVDPYRIGRAEHFQGVVVAIAVGDYVDLYRPATYSLVACDIDITRLIGIVATYDCFALAELITLGYKAKQFLTGDIEVDPSTLTRLFGRRLLLAGATLLKIVIVIIFVIVTSPFVFLLIILVTFAGSIAVIVAGALVLLLMDRLELVGRTAWLLFFACIFAILIVAGLFRSILSFLLGGKERIDLRIGRDVEQHTQFVITAGTIECTPLLSALFTDLERRSAIDTDEVDYYLCFHLATIDWLKREEEKMVDRVPWVKVSPGDVILGRKTHLVVDNTALTDSIVGNRFVHSLLESPDALTYPFHQFGKLLAAEEQQNYGPDNDHLRSVEHTEYITRQHN